MAELSFGVAQIRDPALFQRLVNKLMLAEYGIEYQVVDDSGGDGGLDGFLRITGDLYACYCPEKPEKADFHRKMRSDLRKAQVLRDQGQYPIRRFVFVTPFPLREPSQRLLRDSAQELGFDDGVNVADEYLEVALARHPDVQDHFPGLSYPRVAEALDAISEGVQVLVDSLSASPKPRGASEPTQETRVGHTYSRGIFKDIDRSGLAPVEAALAANVPGALFLLEQFRLGTSSPTLAAASTLLELQHAIRNNDFAAIEATAERGALEARIAGRSAEEAVFRANIAHMLIRRASELDREIDRRKRHMIGVIPLPTPTLLYAVYANRRDSIRVHRIYERVDNEIQSALNLSRQSMNLDALHTTLKMMVYAETKKVDSPGLLARSDLSTDRYIETTLQRSRTAHETSIRTARLLGDAELAEAFFNYALDLMFIFKEPDRGLHFAREEIALAARASLPSLIEQMFGPDD